MLRRDEKWTVVFPHPNLLPKGEGIKSPLPLGEGGG